MGKNKKKQKGDGEENRIPAEHILRDNENKKKQRKKQSKWKNNRRKSKSKEKEQITEDA
jgi:hypothetical protein